MPSSAEIAKDTIEQFKKIQRYMTVARKENATETYAELKSEYLSLKALLNVIGVNLIDIDIIKE
ncbi:MAG: hypothetical protein NC433_06745 [Clostridiales bacterium]|nr:hypothetical protein [Clostridiales bacterium]